MDLPPKVREHLHESLQHTISLDENSPEGAMLVGWVSVAEWMAPDGGRWLSRMTGAADGEPLSTWQRQGYLHNALHAEDEWDAVEEE